MKYVADNNKLRVSVAIPAYSHPEERKSDRVKWNSKYDIRI